MDGPPDPGPPPPPDDNTGKFSDSLASSRRVPADFTTSSSLFDDSAMDTSQAPDVASDVPAEHISAEGISPSGEASAPDALASATGNTEDYSPVDMDTSATPPPSPSRVPADPHLNLENQHLDLSEEALLASDDDSRHFQGSMETVASDLSSASSAATMGSNDGYISGTTSASSTTPQPMVSDDATGVTSSGISQDEDSQWTTVQRKGSSSKSSKDQPFQEAGAQNASGSPEAGPSSRPDDPAYVQTPATFRGGRGSRGRGAPRGRGGQVGDLRRGSGTSGRGGGRGRGAARRGRGAKRARSNGGSTGADNMGLPKSTPPHYRNYLSDFHPWARLVAPRPIQVLLDNVAQVKNVLSTTEYRHLPNSGYLSGKFNRSLFSRVKVQHDRPLARIPFIELQHLEDTIAFRQRSARIISQVLNNSYENVDLRDMQQAPEGQHPTLLVPPVVNNRRPVLYQVVSTSWGTGVILEAKDFFTIGPDRRDLHCIILDYYAVNVQTGLRSFDKTMVSVKDFVWVYDVKPTRQALDHPQSVLARSRIPRTTALDNNSVFFFRAAEFAFVTPHQQEEPIYGIVLTVVKRREQTTSFRAAFEGAPEAVTVTPSICAFPLSNVVEDAIVWADSRHNVSCAMRFSEPPVSIEARDELCELIRQFLPMHPSEGLLPLRVYELPAEERAWLDDRAGKFDSFCEDNAASKRKMSKLFNAACSALAAINSSEDDRHTHWVTATVRNTATYPVRLEFVLRDMPSEAGWGNQRPRVIWIAGASKLSYAKVRSMEVHPQDKALNVCVEAYTWSHGTISSCVENHGRYIEGAAFVDVCVRLSRASSLANPVYESIARMDIYKNLSANSTANAVVDTVYGRTPLGCDNSDDVTRFTPWTGEHACSISGRVVNLTHDQRDAVALGVSQLPVVAIQAAFGTGKTVVGALIAAQFAAERGIPVIVTATTNAAVAQFTETILSLDTYRNLAIVRYVSDTAATENLTPTPVDLNEILKNLGDDYVDEIEDPEEIELCQEFKEGREAWPAEQLAREEKPSDAPASGRSLR
ncbi:hypothetical protein ANCCAN_13001 [Ancylostoma caninum]|uniref:DNA2/NAM7 helicase helicase domain-containing protein n=1 Tax=Ancylostoma caninum TaxID=29170 RepID=A0A368GDI0_ANCCA|nr:hypothetical protein ANCCAN_13001 [Ancylostoma caninum]